MADLEITAHKDNSGPVYVNGNPVGPGETFRVPSYVAESNDPLGPRGPFEFSLAGLNDPFTNAPVILTKSIYTGLQVNGEQVQAITLYYRLGKVLAAIETFRNKWGCYCPRDAPVGHEDPKVLDVRLRPHTRQCLNLQALMSDESEAHGHGEDGQESEENRGPNNT